MQTLLGARELAAAYAHAIMLKSSWYSKYDPDVGPHAVIRLRALWPEALCTSSALLDTLVHQDSRSCCSCKNVAVRIISLEVSV